MVLPNQQPIGRYELLQSPPWRISNNIYGLWLISLGGAGNDNVS